MKKLIQISLAIVVAFALVFGLFVYSNNSSVASGERYSCRVGWNSRSDTCLSVSYRLPGGDYTPNVGWNSKASTMPAPDHSIAYCKGCIYPDVGWNS